MRVPSSAELLDAWERALTAPRALRALTLLATASDDESADEIGELSIGERDRRLMRVRSRHGDDGSRVCGVPRGKCRHGGP